VRPRKISIEAMRTADAAGFMVALSAADIVLMARPSAR
jgi:hypothetical protein